MSSRITYQRAKTDAHLNEILKLQKQNLGHLIPDDQKQKEGFVTLEHDFEILKKMNEACPHFIAIKEGQVVAYALSMLQSFKNDIPLLLALFVEVDNLIQNNNLSSNYIAMGQICVDKSVRGLGVFRGLYNAMVSQLKVEFDVIITEVDSANKKSSNAHKAVGFKVIKTYQSNNQLWQIISLEM